MSQDAAAVEGKNNPKAKQNSHLGENSLWHRKGWNFQAVYIFSVFVGVSNAQNLATVLNARGN